jgi:hypothetical protein
MLAMDGDHKMLELEDRILLERRISKAEENLISLQEDIREIKKSIHWIIGLIFSINSAIIGILIKGFNII